MFYHHTILAFKYTMTHAKSNRSGFLLIELMCGLMLLTLLVHIVFRTSASIRVLKKSVLLHNNALLLARNTLEQLRRGSNAQVHDTAVQFEVTHTEHKLDFPLDSCCIVSVCVAWHDPSTRTTKRSVTLSGVMVNYDA